MFKISFYVPPSHLEQTKQAMFDAGAGRFQQYDCCAWQTQGEGQYRPLVGSDPYTGKTNVLSVEPEYLVEMICETACLQAVIEALLRSHPYETPAYQYWSVNTN